MATETKHTKAFYNTEIPSDWEVKKLGDFVERIVGGGTPSREKTEYWNGNIFWATVKDFTNFNSFQTQEKITETGLKNSASNVIPKGTVITATRMALGKAVKFDVDVAINQDLKAIFPKSNLDSDFLCYWFEHNLTTIEGLGNGSTVKGISLDELKNIKFYSLPLPEQKAIAYVLSTADAAIQTTEKLIAQKEQRKKWLMQQLLTGKKRLKGFSGDWYKKHLKELCKLSKGEQLNKIDLEKTGKFPSYSGGITPSGYTDDWNTDENTIIISEGGNSCGFVNFITTKFWCGGHCYALLDLIHSVNKDFLFQLLKFNEPRIMKLRVGSGLPNIQKGDVENFGLNLPTIEEQTAIAQVLQAADKEINLLKTKATKLREQKKGLMQQLLTGKKRLNQNFRD